MALDLKTFGDPVLKTRAAPVETFDESLSRLAEDSPPTRSAGSSVSSLRQSKTKNT